MWWWSPYVLDYLLSSSGTVGDSLSSSQHPDVFVSSDGGYNWRGTLRGPHHYSIIDSGGLLVAVEVRREGQVKTIKYWTNNFLPRVQFIIVLIVSERQNNKVFKN